MIATNSTRDTDDRNETVYGEDVRSRACSDAAQLCLCARRFEAGRQPRADMLAHHFCAERQVVECRVRSDHMELSKRIECRRALTPQSIACLADGAVHYVDDGYGMKMANGLGYRLFPCVPNVRYNQEWKIRRSAFCKAQGRTLEICLKMS